MNRKNLIFNLAVALLCFVNSFAANAQLAAKVESFPVSDVRLTASPFKHAEDMDINYLLGLDADRLMAPYLKGGGLTPKAENYPNWENTGLDGHIGGHYLSALAYMYAATGNTRIKERLDYSLNELKRAQDAAGDGYLGGTPNGRKIWDEIKKGTINASSFGLNGGWVPLYNMHKTYAGLRDAYLQGGSVLAKDMLIKLTDWMCNTVSGLTDAQVQEMLKSEHGGLNEVFADVASITGNKKYLELAHKFSHQTLLQPLLQHQDKLTGMHANTQIPKVIGFKRIADLEGNKDWSDAASFFWKTVVDNRSVSIGGNSVREHFHPSDNFSSMFESEQGPETCNTYNMLRLTKLLFQTSGDVSFMDYYERALYNHILSTQDPVQGGFVYFTPMRAGHYRVYSQPQTSFWCCVGSGLENHARYGEMIYGYKENDLYVNLFIPSVLNWKAKNIRIEQQNNFAKQEAADIIVDAKKTALFTLHIRKPEWVKDNDLKISVNGQSTPVVIKDGYLSITRNWSKGDKVHLELPMQLRAITTPDGAQEYSFLYGPYVLAAKTGTEDQTGLFADESRGGHIAAGPQYPLSQLPVIVGTKETILDHLTKTKGKSLTFTLKGVQPSKYEELELVPFHQLHECRYMIYFPLVSEQQVKEQQEKALQQEQEKAAIENVTLDKVFCGEQQPESDHFIKMASSNTGTDNNLHWRETREWFSYKLKNNAKNATKVRISYSPSRERAANILVNGQKIGSIGVQQSSGVSVVILDIPATLKAENILEIKIEAAAPRVSPRICEVRLTNEK